MVRTPQKTPPDSDSLELTQTRQHYSELKRVAKVFVGRPLPVIGLFLVLLVIIIAIFSPWIAPYDPDDMNLTIRLQPPSRAHVLGTDSLGRDILSRIMYGSRNSLIVGIGATGMSAIIGMTLGLIAAYSGRKTFNVIMRLIDALMAIPMILLALMIASLLGGGLKNVIIALGIGGISGSCRLMCGVALSIKQNDYVLAARATGMSAPRIILTQILPNSFPPLLVLVTVGLGATILAEAGLSFLGIGITPPAPAWGSMVNDGYKYLMTNPVLAVSPGVAIMLIVFGFNMVGDGLRDALDPRLRGVF
jgi:peptide/nickel transport system permease protein